jgi:hypothetical protein
MKSKLAATLVLAAVVTGLGPGTANAAQDCHLAVATNKYSCNGSGKVRGPRDVIGGKIFTGLDYTGSSLTIWVPKPCPKNDKVDYAVNLGAPFRNHVNSAQAWSSCWVWLYQRDKVTREGPFKGSMPDTSFAGDRTAIIGLS